MLIHGSVALVTGANRQLGVALTDELLARGAAKVYAATCDVSSITDRRLTPVRLDVSDPASIEETVRAAPDVSLLINNAGVDTAPPPLSEEAGLRLALEVGYRGPVAVNRAFARVLGANGGGALVNLLCGLAWFSLPAPGGYSSARAAMWAATNSLREDL